MKPKSTSKGKKEVCLIKEFDTHHPDGSFVVLEDFGNGCRLRIRDYRDKHIKDFFFLEDGRFDGTGTEFLGKGKVDEDEKR